ncbi:MAG: hypothetical protein J6K13_06645 [Clostridia bacterium]|nr:hypothetical protein [Clostridia bacterium]
MQNNQTTIRGYSPQQNTDRMNTLPYQVQAPVQSSPVDRIKAIWAQLDPCAVMLLCSLILGLAYALYATISFWWLSKLLPHLILVWLTAVINGVALFTGKQDISLITAAGYLVSLLLFVNYFYLLLPQAVLCAIAWWNAK